MCPHPSHKTYSKLRYFIFLLLGGEIREFLEEVVHDKLDCGRVHERLDSHGPSHKNSSGISFLSFSLSLHFPIHSFIYLSIHFYPNLCSCASTALVQGAVWVTLDSAWLHSWQRSTRVLFTTSLQRDWIKSNGGHNKCIWNKGPELQGENKAVQYAQS